MADHSQTITNTMNVLGVSPGTLWGVAVWGTDLWGVDEDVWTDTNHQITESLTHTDVYGKEFAFAASLGTLTITSSIESIVRKWDIWAYIYPTPTTDGQEQAEDEFSKVSDGSDDFTQVSDSSTTWTDA